MKPSWRLDAAAEALTNCRVSGRNWPGDCSGLGIHSIADLLFHLPLRYEDRTRLTPHRRTAAGRRRAGGGASRAQRHRARAPARHAGGHHSATAPAASPCAFFTFAHTRKTSSTRRAQPALLRRSPRRLTRPGNGAPQLPAPGGRATNTPLADRLTPVYPSTEGIGQATWLKLSEQALQRLHDSQLNLAELLPAAMLSDLALPSLEQALALIHRPPPGADVAALLERRHPAQHRLAMEELLAHNLSMRLLHQRQRARSGAGAQAGRARSSSAFSVTCRSS